MKRPKTAIGIAMMDLVSNALAASLILFLVMSLMDDPPIPLPQVSGTLVISSTLDPRHGSPADNMHIWLQEPNMKLEKFGEEILEIGTLLDQQADSSCSALAQGNWPPRVLSYVLPDKPSAQAIIVHCPTEGAWETGLVYASHRRLEWRRQEAIARIKVMYLHPNSSVQFRGDTTGLVAPTELLHYSGININKQLDYSGR